MINYIYAEKKKPEHTREHFVRRWRIHGGFAMRFPDFWDPIHYYLQNDCVADVSNFIGANRDYCGVGELLYPQIGDYSSSLATPNLPAIFEDGDQLFLRKDAIHLTVESHRIVDRRHAPVKVFIFLQRPTGFDREVFAQMLERRLRSLASGDGGFASIVRQVTLSHSLEATESFESVVDFCCDDLADAYQGYQEWIAATRQDEALNGAICAHPLTLVTHSCLLYNKDNFYGQVSQS